MRGYYHSKKYRSYIKNIVGRCLQKDAAAWNAFVSQITPLMLYIIEDKFRRMGFAYQKEDIHNLKQDILLSIWKDDKLHTVKDTDRVIPWICVFSSNAVSNYVRDLKMVDPPNAHSLNDLMESPYLSPIEEASDKEIQDILDSAVDMLTTKEKIIIKLAFLYKKRYRDIARILNMPLGTVLVYSKRAKSKLRKELKYIVIK